MLDIINDAANRIREEKGFSIATEFFTSGIFTTDMVGSVSVDDLTEMPEALRERLKAWQSQTGEMWDADLQNDEFQAERIRLNAIGLEIAQDVVLNMPDWKVNYYNVTIEEAIEMHKAMADGHSEKMEP